MTTRTPTAARITAGWIGAVLLALSAAGFATLGIFARFAFSAGVTLPTLLALRFGGTAFVLWAYLFLTGTTPRVRRRRVWGLLGMGTIGYAIQATLYLTAVQLIPVAVVGMLLYTYPAYVALLAWRIDGDQPDRRVLAALGLALTGTTLTAGSASTVGNPVGIAVILVSAVWYAGYIVVGNRIVAGIPPQIATAYVAAGATASFLLTGAALGQLDLAFGLDGWLPIAGIVLISTVVPVVTFFAGLQHVGPARAAILSTLEPVFTVFLAMIVLGEQVMVGQWLGGGLIVAAVLILQMPRR